MRGRGMQAALLAVLALAVTSAGQAVPPGMYELALDGRNKCDIRGKVGALICGAPTLEELVMGPDLDGPYSQWYITPQLDGATAPEAYADVVGWPVTLQVVGRAPKSATCASYLGVQPTCDMTGVVLSWDNTTAWLLEPAGEGTFRLRTSRPDGCPNAYLGALRAPPGLGRDCGEPALGYYSKGTEGVLLSWTLKSMQTWPSPPPSPPAPPSPPPPPPAPPSPSPPPPSPPPSPPPPPPIPRNLNEGAPCPDASQPCDFDCLRKPGPVRALFDPPEFGGEWYCSCLPTGAMSAAAGDCCSGATSWGTKQQGGFCCSAGKRPNGGAIGRQDDSCEEDEDCCLGYCHVPYGRPTGTCIEF